MCEKHRRLSDVVKVAEILKAVDGLSAHAFADIRRNDLPSTFQSYHAAFTGYFPWGRHGPEGSPPVLIP